MTWTKKILFFFNQQSKKQSKTRTARQPKNESNMSFKKGRFEEWIWKERCKKARKHERKKQRKKERLRKKKKKTILINEKGREKKKQKKKKKKKKEEERLKREEKRRRRRRRRGITITRNT